MSATTGARRGSRDVAEGVVGVIGGRPSRPWWVLVVAGAALAVTVLLALSGCGSSNRQPTVSASTAARATEPGIELTVKHVPKAGAVLAAGPRQRTVYAFEKDDTRWGSRCTGACEAKWPPVLTKGRPVAGPGTQQRLLTTVKGANGALQVSYQEHRLYYFSGDKRHRDILGEGSEGLWYVLAPEGIEILIHGKLP